VICDQEKDTVWLSERLQTYQNFFKDISAGLDKHSVAWKLLASTNDIWARDYMPVQVRKDKFVMFRYDPDYLQPKKYRHLRTDQEEVCKHLGLTLVRSSLVVDGGNVVNSKNKVIMCEKVFEENKQLPKEIVIKQLRDLFELENIVFLPWDKRDYTGHADGMVKFIDEDTVFVNRYPKKETGFGNAIRQRLESAEIRCNELPYNLDSNPKNDGAVGIYINYLQMKDIVFMPVFGLPEDEEAYAILSRHFPKVVPVASNDIAKEGGVLNCIAWNVKC
jgi:agmatine deiminase